MGIMLPDRVSVLSGIQPSTSDRIITTKPQDEQIYFSELPEATRPQGKLNILSSWSSTQSTCVIILKYFRRAPPKYAHASA